MITKGVIDRDTIAVLNRMKKNALNSEDSENIEGSDLYAAMYCGALLFARDRRLLSSNAAKRLFEQFRKDFEKNEDSETLTKEDSER